MAVTELDLSRRITKADVVADRLGKVFDVFEAHNLDARLIGSLGKAASIDGGLPSYDSCRANRGIKDIDVVFVSGDKEQIDQVVQEAAVVAYPCRVDHAFAGLIEVNSEGTFLKHKDISVFVDPQVFEKKEGHLLGVTIPTFNPRTIAHLNGISANIDRKTFRNLHAYLRLIKDREDLLPENMYEPFHRMLDLEKTLYPEELKVNAIRQYYHDIVPKDVRRLVLPITRPLRKFLQAHS